MKNEQEIRDKIKELEAERDECIRRGWGHTLLDEEIIKEIEILKKSRDGFIVDTTEWFLINVGIEKLEWVVEE